jgi:hypothetical protein
LTLPTASGPSDNLPAKEERMGEYLDQVPAEVRDHVRQITKTSGLPNTEESVEMIARGWLEKKELFESQVSEMNMEEVEAVERYDEQGCLAMTYSGSLLNIGPVRDEGRNVQYASIGLRQDVPETAAKEGSSLASDVRVGEPVSFSEGPIQSSSPIFKIAITSGDLDVEEQEEQITKATLILTEEFVEVNKNLDLESPTDDPDADLE